MFAKSANDRLQKLLRYAGSRARPRTGVFAVLALLSVFSAFLSASLDRHTVPEEVSISSSAGVLGAGGPATFHAAPAPEVTTVAPAPVHTEESRYRALAEFLARKYKVSERVIFNLVDMAHSAGRQIGIDPLLIIAVIAVESRFNPIAESIAGAKGLMQVIPKYHTDKFKGYGGEDSVFDPQTNILVGSQILKEYIARTGSVNAALQMYAGALNDAEDLYTNKVMSEKQRLQQVMNRPVRAATPKRVAPPSAPDSDATPI